MKRGDRVRVRWTTGIVETGRIVSAVVPAVGERDKFLLRLDDGTFCWAAAEWCEPLRGDDLERWLENA